MEKRTSISRLDRDQGVGIEAAVGAHRELSYGSGMAHSPHRLTQEVGGTPNGVGATLAQPGTSARHRFRRRRPAAGDSLAGRCSCGGGHPPWPVRRFRRWWSPGRWSTARHRVRQPAAQARDSSSRPHPIQLAHVPPPEAAQEGPQSLPSRKRGVDGALSVQPTAPAVPPVRNTSASSIQSPPASADAASVITLSPVFARPGAFPRSTWLSTSSPRPRCWANGWPEESARRLPSADDRRRRF